MAGEVALGIQNLKLPGSFSFWKPNLYDQLLQSKKMLPWLAPIDACLMLINRWFLVDCARQEWQEEGTKKTVKLCLWSWRRVMYKAKLFLILNFHKAARRDYPAVAGSHPPPSNPTSARRCVKVGRGMPSDEECGKMYEMIVNMVGEIRVVWVSEIQILGRNICW